LKISSDCLYFNGYKPCSPYKICQGCQDYRPVEVSILYIHTGGLGDIIRQYSLLLRIFKKYSENNKTVKISIATSSRAKGLFLGLSEKFPGHFKIWDFEDLPYMASALSFDALYNLDRDLRSCGLASSIKASQKWGFCLESNGTIGMFHRDNMASYAFRLGLDDELKFKLNPFSLDQIMAKALGLVEKEEDYTEATSYLLPQKELANFKLISKQMRKDCDYLIGLNLGVGPFLPFKSISFSAKQQFLGHLAFWSETKGKKVKILLLGSESEEKEAQLLQDFVLSTYPQLSVEKAFAEDINLGALYIAILDILITSDTFALHMAQALKRPCLAWFGPTHPQEIRTSLETKLILSSRSCSPCWKKVCPEEQPCNRDAHLAEKLFEGFCSFI
jgi:heptosyltransferase-2